LPQQPLSSPPRLSSFPMAFSPLVRATCEFGRSTGSRFLHLRTSAVKTWRSIAAKGIVRRADGTADFADVRRLECLQGDPIGAAASSLPTKTHRAAGQNQRSDASHCGGSAAGTQPLRVICVHRWLKQAGEWRAMPDEPGAMNFGEQVASATSLICG